MIASTGAGQAEDSETARCLLERALPCMERLAREFPSLTRDQVDAACTDAVFDLLAHQGESDSSTRLLYLAAWRRARALARSERSRRARESRWAAEMGDSGFPLATESDGLELNADHLALVAAVERLLPDEGLRVIFRLWLDGDRHEAAYAAALGLEGLDPEARQRAVKRQKGRLDKFLERSKPVRTAAERLYGDRGGGG